ncbi:hypothetical protein SVAN01_09850 [Stagonosporopsis vannaccii]|nr:hypothetical protein SVAN01_09850 [Stagonosporopsis vannaccii]
MAPPRAGMSTNSPAAQRASSLGLSAHKNVDEEAHDNTQTDYDVVNYESQHDEPQLPQGTEVQKMIIGNLNDKKMHLAVNKKKVKKDYGSVKANLQDDITAFFDAHEAKSNATHSAQLKRLADLLAAKATIESQMTAKLAHLRAHYDAHSRELTSVVGAKIKELK